MTLRSRFIAAGLAALLSVPAIAAPDQALRELIEVLRAEGAISQQAYEALKRTLDAETVAPAQAPAAAPAVAVAPAQDPQVNTKGRFEVTSADGESSFRLGGRIHFDGNWFSDTNDVDFGDGTQLRRAWIDIEGRVWGDWQYKLAYNLADSGRAGFQDVYLQYSGLDRTLLRLGHFKEPLGLELLAASNNITFMERALPTVLLPSRSVGAAVYRTFDSVTATLGVFGEGIDKLSDAADSSTAGLDEGWATSGRLTFAPVRSDTQVLHFGASAGYRKANDYGGTQVGTPLRLRQRPEANVTSIRLVDTGSIAEVDDLLLWGLEAAWVNGPFSLQAEYMSMDISRDGGLPDLRFSGYYLFGSWILTGESRRYNFDRGVFTNPRVGALAGRGGIGAWELAARFSQVDLSDRVGGPGAVPGGEQSNMTLGVNWYPNDNLRFMLNWIRVLDVDRPGSIYDGAEPDIMALRGQIYW
jgi:phosphate-selective porin OprO/OprP